MEWDSCQPGVSAWYSRAVGRCQPSTCWVPRSCCTCPHHNPFSPAFQFSPFEENPKIVESKHSSVLSRVTYKWAGDTRRVHASHEFSWNQASQRHSPIRHLIPSPSIPHEPWNWGCSDVALGASQLLMLSPSSSSCPHNSAVGLASNGPSSIYKTLSVSLYN